MDITAEPLLAVFATRSFRTRKSSKKPSIYHGKRPANLISRCSSSPTLSLSRVLLRPSLVRFATEHAHLPCRLAHPESIGFPRRKAAEHPHLPCRIAHPESNEFPRQKAASAKISLPLRVIHADGVEDGWREKARLRSSIPQRISGKHRRGISAKDRLTRSSNYGRDVDCGALDLPFLSVIGGAAAPVGWWGWLPCG